MSLVVGFTTLKGLDILGSFFTIAYKGDSSFCLFEKRSILKRANTFVIEKNPI